MRSTGPAMVVGFHRLTAMSRLAAAQMRIKPDAATTEQLAVRVRRLVQPTACGGRLAPRRIKGTNAEICRSGDLDRPPGLAPHIESSAPVA